MRKRIAVPVAIAVAAVGADALIHGNGSVLARLASSLRKHARPEERANDRAGARCSVAHEAGLELHEGCREEVLAAARALHVEGRMYFSPADVVQMMRSSGTRYAESTIRTHVISRMCADAPDNHGTTYDDLERVGRGRYRLRSWTGS